MTAWIGWRAQGALSAALGLLLMLVLSACATSVQRPEIDPQDAWEHRRAVLGTIDSWDLRGRVGVKTEKLAGQATLLWERHSDAHKMQMFGPFGGGRIVLVKDQEGARLVDNKNNSYEGTTVEAVLYRVAGWPVPFEALKYWISGLPSPDAPSEWEFDQWGRLERLRQFGWEVRFLEYGVTGDHELPRKIFMKSGAGAMELAGVNHDDIERDVEVRLVIKQWGLKL